jgi:hypothetical protein
MNQKAGSLFWIAGQLGGLVVVGVGMLMLHPQSITMVVDGLVEYLAKAQKIEPPPGLSDDALRLYFYHHLKRVNRGKPARASNDGPVTMADMVAAATVAVDELLAKAKADPLEVPAHMEFSRVTRDGTEPMS